MSIDVSNPKRSVISRGSEGVNDPENVDVDKGSLTIVDSNIEKSEDNQVENISPIDTKSPSLPSYSSVTKAQVEKDFNQTMKFLNTYGETNQSILTHMKALLSRIIQDKPQGVIDYFEEFSRNVKKRTFTGEKDYMVDIYPETPSFNDAKETLALYKKMLNEKALSDMDTEEEKSEENLNPTVDVTDKMHFFSLAGVSIPQHEISRLNIALKNLLKHFPISCAKFWGKIFGTEKNYFIAECELTQDEIMKLNFVEDDLNDLEDKTEEINKPAYHSRGFEDDEILISDARDDTGVDGEGKENIKKITLANYTMPPLPKKIKKEKIIIPPEKPGEGVNKKVYLVCNKPEEKWIMLPDCMPEQIVAARAIKKYFTGNLDNVIISWPPFPGVEKNLLRAQLARISAGTQISPLGFYQFEEETDYQDEDSERISATKFFENLEFQPYPIKDLVDPSMSFWVHHTAHILKQGRATLWASKENESPSQDLSDEETTVGEKDDGETSERLSKVETEKGPPLLTPLSDDATTESMPPWSTRVTSNLGMESSIAVIISNLWPGAFTYGFDKAFDNIYVGWGVKYPLWGFSPEPLPNIEEEYHVGPEVCETDDPTVMMEEVVTNVKESVETESKVSTFTEEFSTEEEK